MNLPKNTPIPKMSRKEAKILWNSLTPQQKFQFNEMLDKMNRGELMLKEVNVNTQEAIQNIVLEHKEKPSAPIEPFLSHFNGKRKVDVEIK